MKTKLNPIVILFLVFIIGGVAFFLLRQTGAKDLDEIVEAGRLRVITDNSTLGFKVDKDSVYGFQYEIVKAFAYQLGVELEISENDDLRANIYDLIEGNYDIVAGLIPVTSEYSDKVLYTNPIQINRQMLVQRIQDSVIYINKQYDLAGDTISIPKNSPYKMLIEHLSDQIADTVYVNELKNSTPEIAVKMVADGIIKYTICSERTSKKFIQKYPNLHISMPLGYQQANCWVVHKNSKNLQTKLNEFLDGFIGSEEYWKLYSKYY